MASDAPARIQDLCDTPGTTYYFRVTGAADGPLWGTDVYTGDSVLAVAAVHAGAVTVGDAAVVRVTVMPPLAQYQGSVRNGVTSHDFGRFGAALSSGPGVNRRYTARRRVHTASGGARHYPITLFRSRRSGNLSTCLRYRVHGLSGTLRNRSRADSAITEVLHVDSDSPR